MIHHYFHLSVPNIFTRLVESGAPIYWMGEISTLATNSMEKKKKLTLKAVSCSASQIPHILLNLKVHYCVYRRLPLIPAMNHINPVHTHPMALDVF